MIVVVDPSAMKHDIFFVAVKRVFLILIRAAPNTRVQAIHSPVFLRQT